MSSARRILSRVWEFIVGDDWRTALGVVIALSLRERRPMLLAATNGAAFVMPVFWNSILSWTGSTGLFSHDLPFAPFPISWQDTGSGIFTLAGAGTALMLLSGRSGRPRRLAALAIATAAAALVIDVYFY